MRYFVIIYNFRIKSNSESEVKPFKYRWGKSFRSKTSKQKVNTSPLTPSKTNPQHSRDNHHHPPLLRRGSSDSLFNEDDTMVVGVLAGNYFCLIVGVFIRGYPLITLASEGEGGVSSKY